MLDKILELETKIVNLDRRGDANKIMEGLKDILKELETKLYQLDREEK